MVYVGIGSCVQLVQSYLCHKEDKNVGSFEWEMLKLIGQLVGSPTC